MKKLRTIFVGAVGALALCLGSLSANAQDIYSVSSDGVRSLFNAKVGINTGVSYEQRLGKAFSARLFADYNGDISRSEVSDIYGFGMYPEVDFNIRWYYMAHKMQHHMNTGSFMSIGTGYRPRRVVS